MKKIEVFLILFFISCILIYPSYGAECKNCFIGCDRNGCVGGTDSKPDVEGMTDAQISAMDSTAWEKLIKYPKELKNVPDLHFKAAMGKKFKVEDLGKENFDSKTSVIADGGGLTGDVVSHYGSDPDSMKKIEAQFGDTKKTKDNRDGFNKFAEMKGFPNVNNLPLDSIMAYSNGQLHISKPVSLEQINTALGVKAEFGVIDYSSGSRAPENTIIVKTSDYQMAVPEGSGGSNLNVDENGISIGETTGDASFSTDGTDWIYTNVQNAGRP